MHLLFLFCFSFFFLNKGGHDVDRVHIEVQVASGRMLLRTLGGMELETEMV